YNSSDEKSTPMTFNTSPNKFIQSLISEVQLFVWIIATSLPSGVVTTSISGYIPFNASDNTTIAKALVPADMLPVFCATVLVATIPVPASPSGGAMILPASRLPAGSSSVAPSSVRRPPLSPANFISGKSFSTDCSNPLALNSSLALVNKSVLYALLFTSIGNMPEASPIPNTFSPVKYQCTYPANVVKYSIWFMCVSLSNMA